MSFPPHLFFFFLFFFLLVSETHFFGKESRKCGKETRLRPSKVTLNILRLFEDIVTMQFHWSKGETSIGFGFHGVGEWWTWGEFEVVSMFCWFVFNPCSRKFELSRWGLIFDYRCWRFLINLEILWSFEN